ncbi:MAG: universal stress protein [Myxococcales bacterium]|nr:universal stress protein [Myxococcales bacterium]
MTPPATTGPVVVALTPDDDRAVLATAAAAAAAGDERLVICSVVDSDREREPVRAALAEQLAEAQLSTPPTLTVRVGDRTAEVLACAADHHAAMVVTGPATARDGVVARWLHPTLPSTLVRAAPAALLVVRAAGASGGIVAATDLSTPEQAVLRAAADAQARGGGDVTALHCVTSAPPTMLEDLDAPLVTLAEVTNTAAAALREALCEAGLPAAAGRVELGTPADTALRLASELDAELLVVGTHGRTGLSRLLFGNLAEELVARAPCSVLVVPLAPPASPDPDAPKPT